MELVAGSAGLIRTARTGVRYEGQATWGWMVPTVGGREPSAVGTFGSTVQRFVRSFGQQARQPSTCLARPTAYL